MAKVPNNLLMLIDEKFRGNDAEAERTLGLPRSTIYDWRHGRSSSYKKYIADIATYFGRSIDYVLGGDKLNRKIERTLSYLGAPYEKRTIDEEECIYRDFKNGFDVEITGCNLKEDPYVVYVWTKIGGLRTVETSPEIKTLPMLKQYLEGCASKYSAYEPSVKNTDLLKNALSIPKSLQDENKHIPILGKIACGELAYAEQDILGYVMVPKSKHIDYALIARGDSMINARILDGDLVFIREQPDIESGEIAAVWVDDEATLKRVYKIDGSLILRAENLSYKDIIVNAKDKTIRVLGKAIMFQSEVR